MVEALAPVGAVELPTGTSGAWAYEGEELSLSQVARVGAEAYELGPGVDLSVGSLQVGLQPEALLLLRPGALHLELVRFRPGQGSPDGLTGY